MSSRPNRPKASKLYQELHQHQTTDKDGLPKGFMSRKEAMARIAARENDRKSQRALTQKTSASKHDRNKNNSLSHNPNRSKKQNSTTHTTDEEALDNPDVPSSNMAIAATVNSDVVEPKTAVTPVPPRLPVAEGGNDVKPNRQWSETDVPNTSTDKRAQSPKTTPLALSSTAPLTKKEALSPNGLKILIMNANCNNGKNDKLVAPADSTKASGTSGKNDKLVNPADRRKHIIQTVILKESPDILLFQEFKWVGITGETWVKYPIPEKYTYTGNKEASILYNHDIINVKDFPATEIYKILDRLRDNANNRLKKSFPMDFDPWPRMCVTTMTTTISPAISYLIIVSWHGPHKKSNKVEYFQYLIEFLRQLKEKYQLPILIAGDFNVDMLSIEECVQPPFKLCKYDASERRTKDIIDFFIVTEELEAQNINLVYINEYECNEDFSPTDFLDHDPVRASVTFRPTV